MDWKKKSVTFMTIAISLVRIGMGYQMSILGQNLLYLAGNMSVSVAELSVSFVGGFAGTIAGAFLAAGIKKRLPRRQFYVMGASATTLAIFASCVPWTKVFWLFVVGYSIGGIAYGTLEAGLNALMLELLNEKTARVHMQLFHLTFAVGAFCGPIIGGYLINLGADVWAHELESCNATPALPEARPNVTDLDHGITNSNRTAADFNGNAWSYHVLSLWLLVPSLVFGLLGWGNIEGKMLAIRQRKDAEKIATAEPDAPRDEPFKDVVWILAAVTGYIFSVVAADCVVHNFLYAIALCSVMSYSVKSAILLNALVWMGMGLGRLVAMFLAKRIRPVTINLFCIGTCIASCILVSLFGQSHTWVPWLWSIAYGISSSILYPSGVSWISERVCVSGRYMFIFTLGGACGGAAILPIAGAIFDFDSYVVIHLITGLSVTNGMLFLLSMAAARGRRNVKIQSKSSVTKECHPQEGFRCTLSDVSLMEYDAVISKTARSAVTTKC